jgi:hypothetical protein
VTERPDERFVEWGSSLMPEEWHAAERRARDVPTDSAPRAPGFWAWLRAAWKRRVDDGPPVFVRSQA